MIKISRKKFLQSSLVGLGSLWLTSDPFYTTVLKPSNSKSKSKFLNVGIPLAISENRDWLNLALERMGQHLRAISNGEISLKVTQVTRENFQKNSFDAFLSSPSMWPYPLPVFIGHLPLPLTVEEKIQWLSDPLVQEQWTNFCNEMGFQPLLLGAGPGHCGLVSNRRELDAKDFSKLKFASCRDLTAQNLKRLGGHVVSMDVKKIQSALLNNKIDVSEAFNHKFWLTTNLLKKKEFYYYANEWVGTQVFNLNIRSTSWKTFNSEEQGLIKASADFVNPFVMESVKMEIDLALGVIAKTAANKIQSGVHLHQAMLSQYMNLAQSLPKRYKRIRLLNESLAQFISSKSKRIQA